MENKLTTGQKKALQDLQDYYEYAKNSTLREEWLDRYQTNLSFYGGEQWLDESVNADMREIGATPYTYNNIEPLLNAYVSLQIRSSKRVGYEASTDNTEHVLMAEYLKQLAYNIQTQNDHVYFSSQKFTASLIGGIGWSYFTYDEGQFKYDYVDPMEVFWDPDDKSLRLDNSSFVCRVRYLPVLKLKKDYPKYAKEFESMVDKNSINPQDMTFDRGAAYGRNWLHEGGIASHTIAAQDADDGQWIRGRSIKIVETYYKKSAKYYETTAMFPVESEDSNEVGTEQTFTTFDRELAEKYSIDGNIVEKEGTQIWRGVYCDNMLLEHAAILAQVPNQKYLPLVPLVLRRNQQGVPYGVVDGLISAQKAHNYLWSTTMHYLDARTLIVSNTEKSDDDKTIDKLRSELRLKTGIIFAEKASEIQIINNENNLTHRMNLLKSNYREFETQTGLYDELKGEQTNAVSGVAIAQRATNSMNAQNALILAYENMLISEGKIMLDTIRGIKNFRFNFKFMQGGRDLTASLDESIALLNFEVYPDTSANFSSSVEEEKARFTELMNSNNAQMLLSSPIFLKELGFREKAAYELAEEYARITGMMQQAAEQEAAQQEMEQQEVSNGK